MNTINKVKVSNMLSARGNREVPNQFVITTDDGIYFQSYSSIIVFRQYLPENIISRGQKVYLDEKYWDYSTTTGKYRNQFLGESIDETRKKIKSGEYLLTNLN